MAAIRRAQATWQGDLTTGSGEVTAATSRAFSELPVTWASRTEEADGRTSPEELIAAAHAACFSMALSAQLGGAGMTPESIDTAATLTLEKLEPGFTVTGIHLEVVARIPGAKAAAFEKAAGEAKANCPISRLLNTKITMNARLA